MRVASFLVCLLVSLIALAPQAEAQAISPADAARYQKLYADARSAFLIGNMKTAAENLGEALKIYQQDGDVWFRYGQALLAQKRYKEAIAAYSKAFDLGAFEAKFRASAEYDMARAHAQLGDKEEAYKWLQQSLDHGYRDLGQVQKDTALAPLHEDSRWEELAATKDTSKMDRVDGWRYDVWLLNREVRRIHYNPYRLHSKDELDKYISQLNADIPKLSDDEIMVRMRRFVAMMGDGHTRIGPSSDSPAQAKLPIQLFWYEEGIFCTAASPQAEEMVGAQVLNVEGKTVEELYQAIAPITFVDNPQGIRNAVPILITMPSILKGLGIAKASDSLTVTILDSAGKTREIKLAATTEQPSLSWSTARKDATLPVPLYMKDRQSPYWFEYLPDSKVVYFQYNSVRDDPKESVAKFAERMFKFIDENDVQALVVDARWNGGGNSFLNLPLEIGIFKSKLNVKGKLFVITGRNTFSAAQNFVTDLDRDSNALFVGEPTGSSPNAIGESNRFTLPYSKMVGSIADLYWERSWPIDNRIWISPDLPAPPVFSIYKENRDPAMEAILAFLKNK